MKNIKLQAWPELVALSTLLGRFERSSGNPNPIYIDFSSCNEVSSTGLTIFLLKVLEFKETSSHKRMYSSNQIIQNSISWKIRNLSFFHHINKYFQVQDLFSENLKHKGPFNALKHNSYNNRNVISLPIYCLNLMKYQKTERRSARFEFRKMIMEQFCKYTEGYWFNIGQIATILTEMIKNSADHTDAEAFFGVDFVEIPEKESIEIHFVFGDIGPGIMENINTSEKGLSKDTLHLSITDAYHRALSRGYSTSGNFENKGLGMSIIREGSIAIDLQLSVVDAYSRGLLTSIETVTHSAIRKVFFNYNRGQSRPFFYYGSVSGEKK